MTINPYEELYKKAAPKLSTKASNTVSMKQAEDMAIQMSLMYNAFGIALKDLVGLLSIVYSNKILSVNSNKDAQKINQQPQYDSDLSSQSSKHERKAQKNNQKTKQTDKALETVDFDKYKLDLQENEKKIFGNNKKPMDKNQIKNTQSTSNSRQSKPVERIETVRGKKQRQTLNGYSCTMCEKFYKLFDTDFTDPNGINKMCNNCSRHRSNLPPTNFFNDFSQQFELDD